MLFRTFPFFRTPKASRHWAHALMLFAELWPPLSRGIEPNVVLCSAGADAMQRGGHWEDALNHFF